MSFFEDLTLFNSKSPKFGVAQSHRQPNQSRYTSMIQRGIMPQILSIRINFTWPHPTFTKWFKVSGQRMQSTCQAAAEWFKSISWDACERQQRFDFLGEANHNPWFIQSWLIPSTVVRVCPCHGLQLYTFYWPAWWPVATSRLAWCGGHAICIYITQMCSGFKLLPNCNTV